MKLISLHRKFISFVEKIAEEERSMEVLPYVLVFLMIVTIIAAFKLLILGH
ncbi:MULTISPECIES: hypothetical protein [Rodentibacter]|uniref:hypothetical protein n=1 Tax=Rodentibacter TaxID=1960084 RepID=UPI0013011A20|nr:MULTISPECIES: hypothetical protein [Rodentibacter]